MSKYAADSYLLHLFDRVGARTKTVPVESFLNRSRSGLALYGVVVANSPGTVDAGYRGEIGVILANISDAPMAINRGDKIAQAVICPVIRARFEVVDALDETARGENGFGSSGI